MKILLDTHYILWALSNSDRLSGEDITVISDSKNEIYYSDISLWEISIKHDKKPESFAPTAKLIADLCEESGYIELNLRKEHIYNLDLIHSKDKAKYHKDPFDRILLSQAKTEGMMLLTKDAKLKEYDASLVL